MVAALLNVSAGVTVPGILPEEHQLTEMSSS